MESSGSEYGARGPRQRRTKIAVIQTKNKEKNSQDWLMCFIIYHHN